MTRPGHLLWAFVLTVAILAVMFWLRAESRLSDLQKALTVSHAAPQPAPTPSPVTDPGNPLLRPIEIDPQKQYWLTFHVVGDGDYRIQAAFLAELLDPNGVKDK